MLHTMLIVTGFYGLCWGYSRLQMYCRYAIQETDSGQLSISPFVIKAAREDTPLAPDTESCQLSTATPCA
jgi:hypothetical protein